MLVTCATLGVGEPFVTKHDLSSLSPIEEFDGDEPINRGLLLKFLSSVRS